MAVPGRSAFAAALSLVAMLLFPHDATGAPADPRHPRPRPTPVRTEAPDPGSHHRTDVESIIDIRSREGLDARRAQLTQLVFGTDTMPADLVPTTVEEGIRDRRFAAIESLRSIDLLTHVMDHGIDSRVYHLKSVKAGDSLVIYHHGHQGGFHFALDAIEALLGAGHDVLALSMPLKGMNSRPVVEIPRAGTIELRNHRWLFYFKRPLHFFMEPITAALNHTLPTADYSRVSMIGFSGGGWSATLYAAMDQRISASYPVAGSIPEFLRVALLERGGTSDLEQTWIPLLQAANYLEMYVMGASGLGRRQIQILNQDDPQIPQAGIYSSYEEIVARRVRSLGPGEFRVFVDPQSSGHELTRGTIAYILSDLASQPD